MMFRETKKPEYLKRAVSLADFLINHRNLPADNCVRKKTLMLHQLFNAS